MCSVPSLKKKKEINFFSPTSRPPKRSLRKQGNRRVRKKEFRPSLPWESNPRPEYRVGPLLDLRFPHRYGTGTGRPTLPYRTLPPSLREEPYAGGRADLPWKPYLRQLLDEDNNHCTSGGAPLELWYWVSSSLCETLFCRVIQVQIDLLFD